MFADGAGSSRAVLLCVEAAEEDYVSRMRSGRLMDCVRNYAKVELRGIDDETPSATTGIDSPAAASIRR
jgi:hypothetical protein